MNKDLAFLMKSVVITGLPHIQGTQGIQGNSGKFQVEENLRETQGNSRNFDFFFNSGKFQFFLKSLGKF